MFWKILIWTGIIGLILVTVLLVQVYRIAITMPVQWEVRCAKFSEELPEGWEPFGYDPQAHMIYLKRVKREEVNEE